MKKAVAASRSRISLVRLPMWLRESFLEASKYLLHQSAYFGRWLPKRSPNGGSGREYLILDNGRETSEWVGDGGHQASPWATFHRPSMVGCGVEHGLMSFNRFSRSARDNCQGKGDENERAFHGRTPSLIVSACPVLRHWAVTKITEFSFQTRHFVSVQDLPGFAPWGAWR